MYQSWIKKYDEYINNKEQVKYCPHCGERID